MSNYQSERSSVQNPQRRPSRRMSARRRAAIRRRRRRRILAGAGALAVLALIIFLVVLLFRSCFGENRQIRKLEGLWKYDEVTEYEFHDDGSGRMYYDPGKAFEFNYTVSGDVIALDFAVKYVTDCEYTYAIDGDTLTLIGGKGTAVIGREYVLKKVGEHNHQTE